MTTNPALLISLFLIAVAAFAPYPADAAQDKSVYAAPQEKALVVFVRDRFVDRKLNYVIVDADRQCLAVMDAKKSELIPMKPGKHTLYALGANVRRVEVDVAAGKTYFIRIYSHTAMAKGMIGVTPARRGTEAFDQIATWTKDLKTSEGGDACRGTMIDDKKGRVQKKIDKTNAKWKADSDDERAKHSLQEKDGLSAKEVANL